MKYINIVLLLSVFFTACNTSKKNDTNQEFVAIKKATTNISDIFETTNKIEETKEVIVTESKTTEISNAVEIAKTKEIVPSQKTEIPKTVVNSNQVASIVSNVSGKVFNHDIWNSLLQKHVSNKGNVNYKGFNNDRVKLNEYIASLSNNVPNATTTKKDKLAYWINAYNALTVDLILRNSPIKSIKDIKKPWDQSLWTLGGKLYNLNEIEHEILRKMNEPRIHFAIVCASFSCPKLSNKAYVASTMETQLTKATKDFLNDPLRNNLSKDKIKLSKIFKWFAKDFKTKGSIIDFMNTYASVTIDQNASSSFKDYNWNLNE